MRWRPKRRPRTEARSRRKNTLASGKGLTNQGPLQKPGLSGSEIRGDLFSRAPRLPHFAALNPRYSRTRTVVDYDQDAQSATIDELVGTEVERPAVIRVLRQPASLPACPAHGRARAGGECGPDRVPQAIRLDRAPGNSRRSRSAQGISIKHRTSRHVVPCRRIETSSLRESALFHAPSMQQP